LFHHDVYNVYNILIVTFSRLQLDNSLHVAKSTLLKKFKYQLGC